MTLPTDHNSIASDQARGRGLVRPEDAHDGCGVACVARLDAKPIHEVIERGLTALDRLEHRGASGADENSGDGAGIMIGPPPRISSATQPSEFGIEAVDMPEPGLIGVAAAFLPRDDERAREVEARIEEIVDSRGPAGARLARGPGGRARCRAALRGPQPVGSASC